MKNPKLISTLALLGVLLALASCELPENIFKSGLQATMLAGALLSTLLAVLLLKVGKNR